MVTKKDCIGAIEIYPPHVVELMLDEQERQGNPRNIAIFQEKADANYFEGGFTWSKSVQGPMFWSSIHNGHMFDIVTPEPKVNATKEVAKKDVEKQVEEPEQSEEIEVGTKVLVSFPDGRIEGKTRERKKMVISVLNTDKGPVYVCASDALLEKLLSITTSTSGLSSHTVDELRVYKDKPEKVKLTLKDISEGKGVGIPPELIEIVN